MPLKNRRKRKQEVVEETRRKNKRAKRKARDEGNGGSEEKAVPHTIENQRVVDETTVLLEDAETQFDINQDSFSEYFKAETVTKIAITTSNRPNYETRKLAKAFSASIPNSKLYVRRNIPIPKIIASALQRNFTHLLVFNEDRKVPSGLLLCYLAQSGPTVYFKIRSFAIPNKMYKSMPAFEANPELLLNHFNTRLGHTLARLFSTLLPQNPNFQAKRLITFHNQRDYIFFRHHYYTFKKDGKKVGLKEIGPKMCLRLQWIQDGLFDPKFGEYSWTLKRHQMEENRRKFYL